MKLKPCLENLQRICRPYRRRVGPRIRLKIARGLRDALLAVGLSQKMADRIAIRVIGVRPSVWLSASEAVAIARDCGIATGRKFFYRLAEKASIAPDSEFETCLDGDGNYGPATDLKRPLLKLRIRPSISGARFCIERIAETGVAKHPLNVHPYD